MFRLSEKQNSVIIEIWVMHKCTSVSYFPNQKFSSLAHPGGPEVIFFLKFFSSNIGGCATFLIQQSEKESRKSDSSQKFTVGFSD